MLFLLLHLLLFLLLLRGDRAAPAAVAHGSIAVVASDKDLVAFGDDLSIRCDPGIDSCLGTAGADCFDLRNGIRQLHQTQGAGEEMCQEIRPEAETKYRYILIVNDGPKLVDLCGS